MSAAVERDPMINGRVIQVGDMFSRVFADRAVNDIESFEKRVVQSRDFDLKWTRYIDHYIFAKKLIDVISGENMYAEFHERGIWPSSENLYLFRAICRYALDREAVGLTDAIAFSNCDNGAVVSFLQIALQNGWGGLMLQDQRNWFYFSHDSWACLATPNDVAASFGTLQGVQIARPVGHPGVL
jgi:hypothetical protein